MHARRPFKLRFLHHRQKSLCLLDSLGTCAGAITADRDPVAQLDRAPASEAGGRAFESRPGHHRFPS